jgi:hypothetical protein
MRMCVSCYTYNVLKTQPTIDDTTTTADINSGSLHIRDLLDKTTSAAKPLLAQLSKYKVTDLISSIEPLHFAPSEEREHHAVAMTHSWQLFQHVYAELASAYAICQRDVLQAYRRHSLSRLHDRQRVMNSARNFVACNASALSTYGRAPVETKLQGNSATEEEKAFRWLHGWVHAEETLNGVEMHNRHELLVFQETAFCRGFAMVLGALVSGSLKIKISLVPPTDLPTAADGVCRVSCRNFLGSTPVKNAATAYRRYPDECVDADYINYEQIAWLLTNHRRSAADRGMDGAPPLTVNLFGSLTRASRGATESFGEVMLTRGAVFVELLHLAMSEYAEGVSFEESSYTDTLAYAGKPDAQLIATLIRHERKMIQAGGGADAIAGKLRKHEEHNGRASGEWANPSIPMSEELYYEFGGMVWPNENPDGWMGTDPATVKFGNTHFTKK